jgi:hypothetical protein
MYDCIMSLRGGWAHAPTIKSVHNVHSREPENVSFMSSIPLYTGFT